jgi:murein DD-endopeptidase MepM/ murein hydrolase activator NlpD
VIALFLSTAWATPQYAWPTTQGAYVSAYYDNNAAGYATLDWSCGAHTYDGHRGTDIAGLPRNTPVYAAATGTVIRRYDGFGDGYWGDYSGGGFGNHVALYHGDGNTTIYGHLNAYSGLPALSSTVDCLVSVGGVGTSGNSTGLHLHFEPRLGTDGVNYYSGWADDPFALDRAERRIAAGRVQRRHGSGARLL